MSIVDTLKDKVSDLIKDWLPDLAVMAVVWLINQSTQEQRQELGEKAGRWLTDNCKKMLGDKWENLETALQVVQGDINIGFHAGLDYDDAAKSGE